MNASGIINFYGLQPHPEGGYYKQTYRSEVLIDSGALPDSSDIEKGQSHQHKVPAGVWFASEPSSTEGFSFVGCTVSPGFDFNDFELATSDQLIAEYPHLKEIVSRLCR